MKIKEITEKEYWDIVRSHEIKVTSTDNAYITHVADMNVLLYDSKFKKEKYLMED